MLLPTFLPLLAGSLAAGAAACGGGPSASQIRALERVYAEANAALMRGDAETWSVLAPLADDFVLFSPFGGEPSRAQEYTPERNRRMGRFFRNGTFDQQLVQSYAAGDMVVLATIERINVAVGDVPQQDWALRVTSVFRCERGRWTLAHRHADPFVESVSVAEAARIARGERADAAK